jgi:hypothetical protein
MKCPYCGKAVRDIPDHLEANPKCSDKHKDKLKTDVVISTSLAAKGLGGYRGQNER